MGEKVKVKLTFDDGGTFITKMDEDDLIKQMKRPPSKRLYIYGVDFTRVKKAVVIED